MKDKTWNILIMSIGASLTLVFLVLGIMINGDTKNDVVNPYLSSLITCGGHELVFHSVNDSNAGMIQCDNGTLIHVKYLVINNGTFLYSGIKVK